MLLCSLKARLITFFKTLLIRFYLNSELMADSIYHKWPSPIAQSVACWTCSWAYSFRGLMTVISTGFFPLSPQFVVSTMVMWENTEWHGKSIVLIELQKGMDRCMGRHDITEILLKQR